MYVSDNIKTSKTEYFLKLSTLNNNAIDKLFKNFLDIFCKHFIQSEVGIFTNLRKPIILHSNQIKYVNKFVFFFFISVNVKKRKKNVFADKLAFK